MRFTCKWALVAAMFSPALLAGCQDQGLVLSELPSHRLDLSAGRRADRPVRTQAAAPADLLWRAQGYRPWRYIVIHHSATASGNAAEFDREHRARGWDGLGYHFVIDNGVGGPDGRV